MEMKNAMRTGLILILSVCLITSGLSYAGAEQALPTTSPKTTFASLHDQNAADDGEDIQYENQDDSIISIAVTTEQAIQLVKEHLQANDSYRIEVVELNSENGVLLYTVIATDAIGDTRCRIVDAVTGEITVRNLWLDRVDREIEFEAEEDGSMDEADQMGEDDRQGETRKGDEQ
ncbi:MAG: hypothetical protein PHI27_10175 [Eubacteriales bacterium]|nr:hypothetical protein [Eubacteriales bacterium]MDD4513442.1 hypothetical protein [Eubacteriales bacterium]